VLGWFGLGMIAVRLSGHVPWDLCLFKAVTGVPCPTCGFTRGLLLLLNGRLARAWAMNPLVFSVLAVSAAVVLIRVVLARGARVRLSRSERRVGWVLAAALLLANWAYVICCVG